MLRLLPSAVAVGMLGLVTSLSIARSLSARSQQLLDANQEVRAQGLSNIVGGFFPATCQPDHSPARASVTRRAPVRRWRGVFGPVGGVIRVIWRSVDRAYSDPEHGGEHPADLLGPGGPPRHSRAVPGQPRRIRGDEPDLRRHLVVELQTAIYAGVLASLFFYLKRTSQPRVQHWRDGEAEVLRVGGSIFWRQPLPASALATLAGRAGGDRGAADQLYRLFRGGDAAPGGEAVGGVGP